MSEAQEGAAAQAVHPRRVFSGVQPTGNLHLGNYLGAVKRFVQMQEEWDCEKLYCMVDLHALTINPDPAELTRATRELAAAFIACGLDPAKSMLFNQSRVSAHAELAWVFNCVARVGWVNRMTQFKEKAGKNREAASVGLYAYPVLMAADILAYRATHVPVGEDQKQHLELARDIAQQRVNARFGEEESAVLKVPRPLILKEGARVMSLTDGRSKMSKSDPNEGSRITLLDPPELITKKIKRAKTDPERGLEFNNPERPETDNLLGLYAILSGKGRDAVARECMEMGWGQFKPLLAEATVAALQPIQERYRLLMNDRAQLETVLREGRDRAGTVADETVKRTREAMGFLRAS